ncbi:hypothetical protein DJ60_3042 [Yersinia enterocolitica]|uniref:hypothetical protein n=1 Tax=Yersinia enterocolitica TaxID=630 RepID=UPI000504F73B|nr:hypothetical protein [Yersinia enterocolitica]AJI83251.1 hypothetical protein CH47_3912 [Yersinia enterocolitica]KGA69317.1 hypothetical protein DJ59_2238 [Yersinia enterocolitica]KGA76340.1 hypothetical protein DJ60_3042 [Yersinia enterocolitica]CNK12158.1 Uncharacterised protein [Yersinia enterocolitica]VFS95228.1 Uncharacterised protein [Yersinia enterocolitica]
MSHSTLMRTIVLKHEQHGDFKFEIYLSDKYYAADIQSRNGDGRWEQFKNGYGFSKANDIDEAEAGCKIFIENLGK